MLKYLPLVIPCLTRNLEKLFKIAWIADISFGNSTMTSLTIVA